MAMDTSSMETIRDGRGDFDFLIGTWKGHQRRLRERLKGSQSWEEFESVSVVTKMLGGLGNFDEVTMERASGEMRGFTVRLFNPETQQWSIYWADSVGATLGAPMVGEFNDGLGVFLLQLDLVDRALVHLKDGRRCVGLGRRLRGIVVIGPEQNAG